MITDDELAVLIMRACSSRNLFVKHHVSNISAVVSNKFSRALKSFVQFVKDCTVEELIYFLDFI